MRQIAGPYRQRMVAFIVVFGVIALLGGCLSHNQPPTAAFTFTPSAPVAGSLVSFDAGSSEDPNGTIVSYEWDLGDGNTATGVTTTHTFLTAGTYEVTLTVTDNAGASDSYTRTVSVTAYTSPVASFSAAPHAGPPPLAVSFDASGSQGAIVTYAWEFGDGDAGTGATTTHTYSSAGTYTARLTVTDALTTTDSTTRTIEVGTFSNTPPAASLSATPTSGTAPLSVGFDGSGSSDPDGTIASYEWSFGDGATGSGVSASHTYNEPGTYTARITVTDNEGASDSATLTIRVTRPPVASFAISEKYPLVGEEVTFDAGASYDPDGTIVNYAWDFGDGTTGTGVTTAHAYSAFREYEITLTVTDDTGATATASDTLTALEPPSPPG